MIHGFNDAHASSPGRSRDDLVHWENSPYLLCLKHVLATMLSPCNDDNEATAHAARGAVVTGPYLTFACLKLRLDEHYKGSIRC